MGNPGFSHLEILDLIKFAKTLFPNKFTLIHSQGCECVFGRKAPLNPLQGSIIPQPRFEVREAEAQLGTDSCPGLGSQ